METTTQTNLRRDYLARLFEETERRILLAQSNLDRSIGQVSGDVDREEDAK
jgi:hypothetical protein